MDKDRVDAFLMKYLVLLPSSFGSLTKVVKTLLILSHGQAQVERGFSINSELLVDNLSNESLIAQRIKTDHMRQKGLQSHEVNITQALLKHVKCARSRYFSAQSERAQGNVKDKRQLDIQELEKDIASTNEHILLLESTISQLNKEGDLVALEAENKKTHSEMKYALAKSNSLKRAANEKQLEMETSMKRKKALIERKESL